MKSENCDWPFSISLLMILTQWCSSKNWSRTHCSLLIKSAKFVLSNVRQNKQHECCFCLCDVEKKTRWCVNMSCHASYITGADDNVGQIKLNFDINAGGLAVSVCVCWPVCVEV